MSRRPAPSQALSVRDRAVLSDVGRLRFLRGDHVRRLHFTEGTPVGRQRRCQGTLRRLTADGYLYRLPRRVGGSGSGSDRFVYQLGYRGQRAVWPGRTARSPEEVGWSFALHSLAVADLVVQLSEQCQTGEVDHLTVAVESEAWRRFLGAGGQPAVLRPDLFVRLTMNGTELVWFVEIDRATEGRRQVRRKGAKYLSYWRTGAEQRQLGAFPKVVWSTPDEARSSAIGRALDELPAPAGQMFCTATAEQTPALLVGRTERGSINQEGGDDERDN